MSRIENKMPFQDMIGLENFDMMRMPWGVQVSDESGGKIRARIHCKKYIS